jgi:hypothetical protein
MVSQEFQKAYGKLMRKAIDSEISEYLREKLNIQYEKFRDLMSYSDCEIILINAINSSPNNKYNEDRYSLLEKFSQKRMKKLGKEKLGIHTNFPLEDTGFAKRVANSGFYQIPCAGDTNGYRQYIWNNNTSKARKN